METVTRFVDRQAGSASVASPSADAARTLSATAPSILYAASDETLDFGSTQSSFAVRLYQISAAVGRGLPATATLTP